ncbi:protein Mpv17-like [Coccinella septempunctata]|uniref:protein Mpv17-like n=1 Tax=Coccinella septempunctata TaxID=41139 RepID=UPI001D093EB9|nr:protein Mpv17-like [Coccinella septempunctata]
MSAQFFYVLNKVKIVRAFKMSRFVQSYKNALQKYPVIVQSVQVGTLMGIGDVIAQKFVEQRHSEKSYDFRRTANFVLLGTFFLGPVNTRWFRILDKYVEGKPAEKALKKVALDQFVYIPCLLAVFLTSLEYLERKSLDEAKRAVKLYYWDVMKANYTIWPLVQICNFYFVPLNYQTLVVQVVSLGWNTYISYRTHKREH